MFSHATHPIEQHPDLMALRAASDDAAVRPVGQAAEALSMLAGLYLAISPWVVDFHAIAPALTANNLIIGLVLVALALGFVPAFERTHSMGVAAAAIGVWVIVAPWAIHSSPTDAGITANNVFTGALVFVLAVVMVGLGVGRRHHAATPAAAPDRPMPR